MTPRDRPATAVVLLADRLDCVPLLARWFRDEWPDYYAGRAVADVEREFMREANREALPLRLVAFSGGVLAGTVVLRERAMEANAEYTPGLGGWYVTPRYRGRGIGSALLRAGVDAARRFGYTQVYAATATAGGIVERLGWERIRTIVHRGEALTFYRYAL